MQYRPSALGTVWLTCMACDAIGCAAFRSGQAPPLVVDFQISCEQAVKAFEDFQRKQCMHLHASGVLKGGTITAALLPFWLFDAAVTVECKGSIGRLVDK